MSDGFEFWRNQLAGKNPETRLPKQPEAGYYRAKRGDAAYRQALKDGTAHGVGWNAVAIWKDGETWCCTKQYGADPQHEDEICELFASVCRNAISYELYQAVVERGEPWPEEVSERGPDERQQAMYGETDRERALKEAPAEIGHNSGEVAPFEIMRERIADVNGQIAKYLEEIGGSITTQEQSDKVANYSTLLGELEKEATAAHKAEKEPWLEGGRVVDANWKPIIEKAMESKRRIKANLITPFLVERQRQADAEAKKERERLAAEQAAREAEAKANGEEPPPPPVMTIAPARAKAGNRDGKGVSLRTVKATEITDLPALAAYLASRENPPADFVEVCRKLADKIIKAGVEVPGARQVVSQAAA